MDTVTELTCPECGEQQTSAEECASCGANLTNLEEDIPTMQGQKTVSRAWPGQAPTEPPSSGTTTEPKSVQEKRGNIEPVSKATFNNFDTAATEKSKEETQPASTLNSQQPEGIVDDEPSISSPETPTSQHIILPWKTLPDLELVNKEHSTNIEHVQSSTITSSDSIGSTSPTGEEPPAISLPMPEGSSSSSDNIRHPLFWGSGQSLFGIFIVNAFLTLVTFGIYSFWGRVRVRSFLNSQTSFAKARFAYHGTGKELLTGWLKAMLIFGLPYLSLSAIPYVWQGLPQYFAQGLAGLILLCFIPVAVVGAHRYRLSRTSLLNIRFSFRGTVSDYTKLWLKGSVLTVLTLGIYYPFFENERRRYLVTHSQLGSQTFDYDGTSKGLLVIYSKATALYLLSVMVLSGTTLAAITTYLSMPVTDMKTLVFASGSIPIIMSVGLIFPWFYVQAARQRFFWNHTQFGEARFISTVTAWKIFELRLGHLLLLICTLGLAWPWVQVRNLQFFYYYTGLQGAINLHQIEQDALDASPTGEELASFFDTGFDLG